jgi:hypothetical protein
MIDWQKYRKLTHDKKDGKISKSFVYDILGKIENDLIHEAENEHRVINVGKIYKPDQLAKYDVVTTMVCNSPHPAIVFELDDAFAYVMACSSTEGPHVIHTFKESRLFRNTFATNTIVRLPRKTALNNFVGIFDSVKEADIVFAKLTDLYANLFKIHTKLI